ncbi:hypothetical protein [Halobacteriovorax sp. RT-2-1]
MDFSHLYARTNQYNSEEEFDEVINKLKEELGEDSVKNMHIHISGISTNSKGDLKHLNLEKSDFNWKDLLKSLKKNGCGGYMICNSPNLEDDALMLKNYYNSL